MESWMTSLECLGCWACSECRTAAAVLQQGCIVLICKAPLSRHG
jgi:hypothetical protein